MAPGRQPPAHRIRKAVFDLRLEDEATAFRRRKEVEEAWHRTILPVMEDVFDACAPDGQVLRIDRLDIDLGRIDPNRLDMATIRRAIFATLAGRLTGQPAEPIERFTPIEALEATLLAFLRTGAWPWHAAIRSMEALETALAELEPVDARRVARRLAALIGDERIRLRLAYQFRPVFVRWLVTQLHPDRMEQIFRVVSAEFGPVGAASSAEPGDIGADTARAVLLAILHRLAGETAAPTSMLERWAREERRRLQPPEREASGAADGPIDARTRDVVEPAAPADDVEAFTDGLYVRHAGIVLLHPFLDRFFRHLGLVTDGQPLASTDHRVRAAHLLYHLATGQEQPEEHETALLKMLAGLPLHHPLVRELVLAPEDRDESERLLRAAIDHWDKLKNTSPDGLREAFLQREGKLVTRPDGWRLVVEQRAVDVLLDSLPWSVSIVRLPWMATPVWVDWA